MSTKRIRMVIIYLWMLAGDGIRRRNWAWNLHTSASTISRWKMVSVQIHCYYVLVWPSASTWVWLANAIPWDFGWADVRVYGKVERRQLLPHTSVPTQIRCPIIDCRHFQSFILPNVRTQNAKQSWRQLHWKWSLIKANSVVGGYANDNARAQGFPECPGVEILSLFGSNSGGFGNLQKCFALWVV